MVEKKLAEQIKETGTFLTPELVKAQGNNDREFLTLRVKLLLDAKKAYPQASFEDISHLADLAACGCGCCCCCSSLALPGSNVINPPVK